MRGRQGLYFGGNEGLPLTDLSLQAFELWQRGAQLPEPLATMLAELSDVESRLSVLRAQKFAKLNTERIAADDSPQAEPDGALPAAADGEAAMAADGEAAPDSEATDASADAETAAEDTPRPAGDGAPAGEPPAE